MFSNKDPHIIVAVEVGTHKVSAAVAELSTDGSLMLLGVGEASSTGVRKGEVTDFQLAQQSISQALLDAEKQTEVQIQEVYLSLTGSHIESRSVMVRTAVDEEDHLVTMDHVAELQDQAQHQVIPRDHALIHELLQRYYLDHQTPCDDPVGLSSQVLEGSFHLVYGLQTRLETTVRCIQELGIEVKSCALASYASAQSALTSARKKAGAVVIDIGAGVTDYVVYVDGAVELTGVLGVGGDHLTQDLSLGLKIPYARAEKLKIEHGALFMDGYDRDAIIELERDINFDERRIYREAMTEIMRVRQEEILQLVEEDIRDRGLWPHITAGVYLTGGASQVRGLDKLARQIFPVQAHLVTGCTLEGEQTYSQRPDLGTVMGLLRYAQQIELRDGRPRGWERFRRSLRAVFESMRLF